MLINYGEMASFQVDEEEVQEIFEFISDFDLDAKVKKIEVRDNELIYEMKCSIKATNEEQREMLHEFIQDLMMATFDLS